MLRQRQYEIVQAIQRENSEHVQQQQQRQTIQEVSQQQAQKQQTQRRPIQVPRNVRQAHAKAAPERS